MALSAHTEDSAGHKHDVLQHACCIHQQGMGPLPVVHEALCQRGAGQTLSCCPCLDATLSETARVPHRQGMQHALPGKVQV